MSGIALLGLATMWGVIRVLEILWKPLQPKAARALDKHAPYATGTFVITGDLLAGPIATMALPTHPAACLTYEARFD